MSTVFQLNKASPWVIFYPGEILCITCWAFARTFFTTQTDARVAAIEGLWTWFVAGWTITWLMATLTASLMRALPGTGLIAWNAGLPTFFLTSAVAARVLTWSLTRGAIAIARLQRFMRADQEALALVKTCHMEASLETFSTGAATGMATLELLLTWGPAHNLLCFALVKARILLAVATLENKHDLFLTHCGATPPTG